MNGPIGYKTSPKTRVELEGYNLANTRGVAN
jgi:hypothetical protein